MRLTDRQRAQVVGLLRERFGEHARIVLFGSRTRDDRRGGDIDLYVETGWPVGVVDRLLAADDLERLLDCPVDLLVRSPGDADEPIHRIARATGVERR